MKTKKVLFMVMVIIAMVMSCTGMPGSNFSQIPRGAPVPEWLAELPGQDELWGIGFVKLQNESLAMQRATQLAQQDVAQQIGVLVQGSLTSYANESGDLNNARSIQSIEAITRTLTNMNLTGATPNIRTRTDDGTWWVRVSYRKADAQRDISRVVNNEMANYAEFRAAQALRQLEFDLERTQSRPTPRTEQ